MNLEEVVPGLDSLDWATVFMDIENELGVTVTAEDAQHIRPNLRSWIEVVATVYRRQHPG